MTLVRKRWADIRKQRGKELQGENGSKRGWCQESLRRCWRTVGAAMGELGEKIPRGHSGFLLCGVQRDASLCLSTKPSLKLASLLCGFFGYDTI